MPNQAFVVNTGDGTVSQIVLNPYGQRIAVPAQDNAVGPRADLDLPDLFTVLKIRPARTHILVANFYSDDVVGIAFRQA